MEPPSTESRVLAKESPERSKVKAGERPPESGSALCKFPPMEEHFLAPWASCLLAVWLWFSTVQMKVGLLIATLVLPLYLVRRVVGFSHIFAFFKKQQQQQGRHSPQFNIAYHTMWLWWKMDAHTARCAFYALHCVFSDQILIHAAIKADFTCQQHSE